MFPETTELLLIGFSIESVWFLKTKSNTLTPKTPLADILTQWNSTRDEWNHLLCLFNISHFRSTDCSESDVEKNAERCRSRKSHSKIETDDEFGLTMQRKDSWRACQYCIRKPRWKPDMIVNFLWAHGLGSIWERGDLSRTLVHQATQSGMLIRLGLLKSGNLMNWWKLEQADLFYSHSTRTDSLLKPIIWTLTPNQNQKCRLNPAHSCTGWMIKCERGSTNLQKMQQKTVTKTLWYGECSWFLHYKHLYSWRRIT